MTQEIEKIIAGLKHCMEPSVCDHCLWLDLLEKGKGCQMFPEAIRVIEALWEDLEKCKSCLVCRWREECSPDGEGEKAERFYACKGSMKLMWEWRGVRGR